MSARLTVFRNLFNNIAKLDSDKLMKNVLKNDTGLQQDILDLNRQDQLYEQGTNVQGYLLGEYSRNTIVGTKEYKGKEAKGQKVNHIPLYDTGEFYSPFKVKIEPQDFIITADLVVHGEPMKSRAYGEYGSEILGLTEESKAKMRGWLKAPFVNEMRKAIFK